MEKIKSLKRENSRKLHEKEIEMNIEYSSELRDLKQTLVNFFIKHFEDDEYMAALDLTNALMSKSAEEGFMAGFRKGKAYTWEFEESGEYVRIGLDEWAYNGE